MTAHRFLDPARTPPFAKLQALFDHNHRVSQALIGQATELFGIEWATDFEVALFALCPDDAAVVAAAKDYSALAFDSMRCQMAFEVVGEHPSNTPAQVASEVYFNAAQMLQQHLPELFLSHCLWPHHYGQLVFFGTAFAGPLRISADQQFADIGVGTAIYSGRLPVLAPCSGDQSYDISPSSCRFDRSFIDSAGWQARFTMDEQDIMKRPVSPRSWPVCDEVQEHLEQPVEFLKALRAGLAPCGKAFTTAALNVAHADHAYLYRSANEVWQHLGQAGCAVEQCSVGASYAPHRPDGSAPLLAAFAVH